MMRLILSVLLLGALVACQSTPTDEQKGATVEDRAPDKGGAVVERAPVKPVDPSAQSRGVSPDQLGSSALTDPKNILSKRSIFFDYDSNLVKDEYKPVVQAHARYLQ